MLLTRKQAEEIIERQQQEITECKTTISLLQRIQEQDRKMISLLEKIQEQHRETICHLSKFMVIAGAFIQDPTQTPKLAEDHENFATKLINLAEAALTRYSKSS